LVDGYSHAAAVTLYRAGKYKEDEAMCLGAIRAIEKREGKEARALAEPMDDLATVYLRLARFGEAKPWIERAEKVLDKSKPADAILLGRLSINKGWRLYALAEVRAAEKVFEEGKALLEKYQKGDSLELAEVINNLGLTYTDSEDPETPPSPERVAQAKVMLLKGWEMRRKLAGDLSPECAESLNNIGMHLLYHGEGEEDLETALSTLKKALEATEKVYGPDHPETAVSHTNLAAALHLTEDEEGADEHVRKALAMTEKWLGKDHLDRSYELQLLGELQEKDGKFPEAETSLKEAVRILEAVFGKDHVNVANGLEALRSLYETTGDEAKEKAVAERIEKLRGKEI
jgi:tetratricopeptide (TPR) repeat protein